MAAKPTYDEQDCPLCADHVNGHCDDCHQLIPNFDAAQSSDHVYKWMGGNGFKSHTATHSHFRLIAGLTGRGLITRELCRECYLKDFSEKYPGAKLPFPHKEDALASSRQSS